jgi:putative ABC transport system ATP-binding protein
VTSAISMRDVRKTYKKAGLAPVPVLQGLNLEVEDGQFLALMGPSGSGKTTVLNLMGGIDRADDGEVVVCGHHLEKLNSGQLGTWRSDNVGFVFQFYHLLPILSAASNVELPLLLTNLTRAQRHDHVKTALDIVGLSERAGHKPAQLSGGQQQRVGIARAIVTDPKLLLCDEPTGNLDRTTADEIMVLLRTLNERHNKTIVMVTHDPKAAGYATGQLHLDKGALVEQSAASA